MNFSDRLISLRKENKWTQSELATKLGIARSTVSMYEKGGHEPSFELLNKLTWLFDVDLNYLLGHSDTYTRPSETMAKNAEDADGSAFLGNILPPDEFALLMAYRSSSKEIRAAVRAVLRIK